MILECESYTVAGKQHMKGVDGMNYPIRLCEDCPPPGFSSNTRCSPCPRRLEDQTGKAESRCATDERSSQPPPPTLRMEADLLVDATWKTCVGMCICRLTGDRYCDRLFVSRERFDDHIAPLLRELVTARRIHNEDRARIWELLDRLERFEPAPFPDKWESS